MIKVLIIFAVVLITAIRLYAVFQDKIKFFSTGADSGFTTGEISMLWNLAKICQLDEPLALYFSVPALNKSITQYIQDSKNKDIENTPKVQNFLSKLYAFRTKIEVDSSRKKGLESTKYLDKGQRLRIILPGHGVFSSEILNNGRELIIRTPMQNRIIKVQGADWIGKKISVYLWRKGDANYVFDTTVTNSGIFNSNPSIYLAHSNELFRSQKRNSVRAQCNLYANLYFIESEDEIDYSAIEQGGGFKCLIEDISEDGALIRVGGKGKKDSKIKIQFEIAQNTIIMFGLVRAVEYNEKMNQSRLHFECLHIENEMRNQILSFVYNVLPQEEKDVIEALKQTEDDANEQGESVIEAEIDDAINNKQPSEINNNSSEPQIASISKDSHSKTEINLSAENSTSSETEQKLVPQYSNMQNISLRTK